ncbi:MAG TPA: acetate--CoA ligase family protein [Anaerolineales bacterium]|nr:acetate--CoA ligase family protein [Anaerolineales bacterium]
MLDAFFHPRGVVVIGASQTATKLGYGAARNLVVSGYQGEIHFVNPHGGSLFSRPIHRRLEDVPDPVDLAVILIPAKRVPDALESCGKRGLPFAIIGSGGFRETGPEGERLEQECLEIARRYGMRLLGPNCIGYLDTHLPIDTTFLPLPGPIQGDIAFLSHSGAICEAVIDWARGQGFGLSRLVSLGNQLDLTEADVLPPTGDDPQTRVIAMYLEGVAHGRAFIEQARRVTERKPVLAIKVGRSEGGRRAVASHTGALAGRDAAYDAAFRASGVIRADSSEEMFDWARALAWCPLPTGRRMAILTNAGGPGAIGVDALEAVGLELAALSEATRHALREFVPAAASVRNPVDMLASAGPMEFANGLAALLEDEGVDGVMVILPPPPMTTAAEVAGAIIPVVRSSQKPIVVALMGEELIAHAARLFRQARVPDYRFPERAASALGVLVRRAEQVAAPPRDIVEIAMARPESAVEALARAVVGTDGFVDADTAARVAAAYGIPVPAESLARNPGEAVAIADSLGYPVAIKVASPDIPHKSDVGGVRLGLASAAAVAEAFPEVTTGARAAHPSAAIQGVTVQAMAGPGQDVILGAVQDEQFGPLVMFGSGGIEVEALRDVAFALAPLSRDDAERLVESTWAGKKLHGYRGVPAADFDAVLEAVVAIGRMAADLPQLVELEVNPLRAHGKGGGVRALDLRMRLRRRRSDHTQA